MRQAPVDERADRVNREQRRAQHVGARRIDVPGHRDVDERKRPSRPSLRGASHLAGGEDESRGPRRRDHRVGRRQDVIEVLEGDRVAAEGLRDGGRLRDRPVGHPEPGRPPVGDVARGKPAGVTGADHEDVPPAQLPDCPLRQAHGRLRHRHRPHPDVGFGPGPLAGVQGGGPQPVRQGAQRLGVVRAALRLADLAEDLVLAEDHRIQSGRHAKQMASGPLARLRVDVRPGRVRRGRRPGARRRAACRLPPPRNRTRPRTVPSGCRSRAGRLPPPPQSLRMSRSTAATPAPSSARRSRSSRGAVWWLMPSSRTSMAATKCRRC